jgi:hypothetical protein
MSDTFLWNGFKVRIDTIEDCDSFMIDEPQVGDTVFIRVRCSATIVGKEKGPEWDATIQYTAGDRVIHNGVECVITETFSHPIPVID